MQKTYVLDANVLLQAPYALESFEDNHMKRETTPDMCSASWRDYGSKETW